MTLKQRREEVEYFETLRGSLLRNLAYAGIAATWAIRENAKPASWSFVLAILMFAVYLALDAIYVHRVASAGRKKIEDFASNYKRQNGKAPGDDVGGPIPCDDIRASVHLSEKKIYILILAYAFLCIAAATQLFHWDLGSICLQR